MRFDGNLKSWNDDRGFGFIQPAQGGQDIFVHIKAFPGGSGRPVVGQALTFEVESGPDGKKRARAVQYPIRGRGAKPRRGDAPANWSLARLLVAPMFAGVWYFVAHRWQVNTPYLLMLYAAMSVVAFFAYALDKSAAVAGRWRTSESTLHLLSLLGGWPGALLAQQLLRHKTAKPSFVAMFWGSVVANVAGFVGWHSGILMRV